MDVAMENLGGVDHVVILYLLTHVQYWYTMCQALNYSWMVFYLQEWRSRTTTEPDMAVIA
jgi:hypothetical protein